MAQKYRKAKRIILAVFLIFYSLIVLMAFFDSWKTGLMWLIAGLSLFVLFISYNSSSTKRLNIPVKIILILIFLFFFGWGGIYLPKRSHSNPSVPVKKVEQVAEKQIQTEENIRIDSLKLHDIQNDWATSVIKEWNGSYIEDFKISENLDKLYFQLTDKASKGNWRVDAEIHQSIFQDKIDSLILANFKDDKVIPETKVFIVLNDKQEAINTAQSKRRELIARQFSSWNGANRYLQNYIKDNMNDPDCYEHLSTAYSDEGSYILVNTKIRGCNSFGAKMTQVITAKIDLNGNILSIN